MSVSSGRFVWYELMTTDTKAAQAFYGSVVGWGTQPSPGDMPYTLFTAGEVPVGGLMAQPEQARQSGAPPAWIAYVAVADVDQAADQVKRLGGNIYVPPTDIPDIGRFSVVTDPQAAAFNLFAPSRPGPNEPLAPGTPGHVGWHELHAADWQKAFDFYAEMFGWQKAEPMDMGPMGTYQLFSAGEHPIGGMFNKPPAEPRPYWLYYFNVADIDAAAGRVTAGGGKILNGPQEVPGGAWIIQGMDPQGAMFALVGKRG
ncbi:VOC family protein [Limobrevibacterium gyesilva]|uniref:VOC family protein n=1 Tax=Limobrevibacterium gyesilva TaxID=2991712 RepID=A0AA41YJ10_9PROT|nr:VOC family protein [Limobrevibacterium gyesilva]MCW3474539.1 VOC family protein [Limobrevibacterium gyesilva]